MITEDYVSFGVAKLLKEKGFDGQCATKYDSNGWIWDNIRYDGMLLGNNDIFPEEYLSPTLQMAMKWLRETHKIEIRVIYDNDKLCWYGACNPMNESQILLGFGCKSKSYEEACEEAIKYCLENLI